MSISFGSDNHSGIHPRLLQAIEESNTGHSHSYGMDELSLQLQKSAKELFGQDSFVYPVFNGTAANVLCLAQLVKPHQSFICAKESHLHESECAAPEKHIGCKVHTVETFNGKIKPEMIDQFLIRKGDQHYAQVKAVSITQPTEYGTLYSKDELSALKKYCADNDLYLHIDGARFIHAATRLDLNFKQIMDISGADALSFGGTKNGLLFGELCVFKNKDIAQDFKYRRKQFLQLPSKQRFISAQFNEFFKNNLWSEISEHQCNLAKNLAHGLQKIDKIKITQSVDTNAVFAIFPKEWVKHIRNEFFFYIWNEKTFEVRLLISFDHQQKDIDSFINKVKEASEVNNGKD